MFYPELFTKIFVDITDLILPQMTSGYLTNQLLKLVWRERISGSGETVALGIPSSGEYPAVGKPSNPFKDGNTRRETIDYIIICIIQLHTFVCMPCETNQSESTCL